MPMNFKEATPVQEQTIPVILQKRDLIACATKPVRERRPPIYCHY